MSETIDFLLVSLGLETDAKSFQTANDAVKGIKDGILQLAAAIGTGVGLKDLTADLSASVLKMDRLSKITNFTVKQIDGLRYAMRNLGLSPDAANQIVQKIPDLIPSLLIQLTSLIKRWRIWRLTLTIWPVVPE
ncbi:hypothetical protein ACXV6R_004427 [Yersinia enterocolitica]